MKINIFDAWKLEIDWKAVAAIAVAVVGCALIKMM